MAISCIYQWLNREEAKGDTRILAISVIKPFYTPTIAYLNDEGAVMLNQSPWQKDISVLLTWRTVKGQCVAFLISF